MGEPQIPASVSPPEKAVAPVTPSTDDLAKIVCGMNRFLSKFAGIQPFADAKLSVADWTVLMLVMELKETRYPNLAGHSGIAEQRIVRILEVLVAAGLILEVESPDPTRPNPILSLTEAGKARLGALNEMLQPLLTNAFGATPNHLVNVKIGLQPLMRIIPL